MNIDLPHMIMTILLILLVSWGVNRTDSYRNATRGKRFLLMAIPLFIVLLMHNLAWQSRQP